MSDLAKLSKDDLKDIGIDKFKQRVAIYEEVRKVEKINHTKALEKKYPKMLLVTSTGAAAEYVGGCMGVFLLAGEHNNRPYYRQKHTLDTEGASFLYSHDIWYLGCE